MKTKFTIYGKLPDLNTIINKSKRHWSSYASLKEEWTVKVWSVAKKQRLPKHKKVDIVFHWYCKNRKQDKDGICGWAVKPILDGLVMANVLQNDGWKQIGEFTHKFSVDKQSPRVEVELIEIGSG